MTVDSHDHFHGGALDPHDARRLAELAAAGSHDAWERIYRAVYPGLRSFAVRRVGPDAAEDVVSETMMRAVANISRFRDNGAGLDPWLFGIARRVIADHHRQVARRRSSAGGRPLPMARQPDEAAVQQDEHAALRAEFDRLPAADQELLELRVIAGLSPEMVGRVLGKRAGAVRTAQSRALDKLRTRLGRS